MKPSSQLGLFSSRHASSRAVPTNSASGNTTCSNNNLDWYTSTVGETPCMTYWRLRLLCDSNYTVPTFRPERPPAPGDQCDSELSECCCNSIAWNLSMLCYNCQRAHNEAPTGSYYHYRFANSTSRQDYCGTGTNGSLPDVVQDAVCNENIDIPNWLYPLRWGSGEWWFTEFMDEVQLDQSANGTEARVHCGNTATGSDATSGGLPSLVPTDVGYSTTTSGTSPSFSVQSANHSAERSSISDGTVVGATLGGVAVLIGILGLVVRLLVKKPQSHITPMQMKYDLEMHDAVPHAGCHAPLSLLSSGTHTLARPPSVPAGRSMRPGGTTVHPDTATRGWATVLVPEENADSIAVLDACPPPAYESVQSP